MWKNIDGLPEGIRMKIYMGTFKEFKGLVDFKITVDNMSAVMSSMEIQYPLTVGDYNDMAIQEPSEGVYP